MEMRVQFLRGIDYTTNETDVTNLRAIYIDAVSGFEVN